jgi:uncharacterized protein (DUF1330 family)
MGARLKIVFAAVAGAAMGAAAMQGLQAQNKPKAYLVTETEVLDEAALAAFAPQTQANLRAAGGRTLAAGSGKIMAVAGSAPPKRVTISEWETVEKAQAYRDSAPFKDLQPQRDKALKLIRAYIKEGVAN